MSEFNDEIREIVLAKLSWVQEELEKMQRVYDEELRALRKVLEKESGKEVKKDASATTVGRRS